MVRLFQTQLEHYEKVEGTTLSLEGKANQLGQMVGANLQMAMQGLVVIPLFAGYDLRLQKGRIFTYDVTGGRFEETDFHATGSGGRDAKNTVKLSYRERLGRDEAVELAVTALVRGGRRGHRHGWSGPAPGDLPGGRDGRRRGLSPPRGPRGRRALPPHPAAPQRAGRGRRVLMTMPYYVAPEQVMKDRAEYAQKGIARGRALVGTTYDKGVLIVAENPSSTLHKISEIYDRVAFAGVGRYNEFDQLRVAGVRHADTKGYALLAGGRRRALARQRLRAVPRPGVHPRDEAPRGRDPRRGARPGRHGAPAVPHRLRRHGGRRATLHGARWGSGRDRPPHGGEVPSGLDPGRGGRGVRCEPVGPDPERCAPADLEVAVLEHGPWRRAFRRVEDDELAELLARGRAGRDGRADSSAGEDAGPGLATEETGEGAPGHA